MTSAAASPASARLGRIAEVRVRITYDARGGGPASEVCLLDVPLADSPAADLEDRLLDAVTPLLEVSPVVRYEVHLDRSWTNRDAVTGRLDLRVELTDGDPDGHRDAVASAFRAVLAECGRPGGPDLHRDEALTRARVRAAQAFPALHAERLGVAGEARGEGWTFQLVAPDGERFAVLVGFVDGFAGSVQVRRRPPLEVFDSLGV